MKKRYILIIIIPICLILIGAISIFALKGKIPNSDSYPGSTWGDPNETEDSNSEADEDSIYENNKKPQPNTEAGWGPIS